MTDSFSDAFTPPGPQTGSGRKIEEHLYPRSSELRVYRTGLYSCSYLPGLQARSQVIDPATPMLPVLFQQLLHHGFRRSGDMIYRPACDHCQACLPLRVDVAGFAPDRSQRRAWKRHQSLSVNLRPLRFDAEHFALYQRYQQLRHQDQAGADETEQGDSHDNYSNYLLCSPVESALAEFREPPGSPEAGRLRMVSLIDFQQDSLSAVYTFYDPDVAGSSYGVFNVLWQIRLCHQLHLPWLFLGYYIRDCRKMAYKRRYQPAQGLHQGEWLPLARLETLPQAIPAFPCQYPDSHPPSS